MIDWMADRRKNKNTDLIAQPKDDFLYNMVLWVICWQPVIFNEYANVINTV